MYFTKDGQIHFHDPVLVILSLNISIPSQSVVPLYSLPVLTAVFPSEPGLASFIEAKDDGIGDNC